jgi:hypothetical protein
MLKQNPNPYLQLTSFNLSQHLLHLPILRNQDRILLCRMPVFLIKSPNRMNLNCKFSSFFSNNFLCDTNKVVICLLVVKLIKINNE